MKYAVLLMIILVSLIASVLTSDVYKITMTVNDDAHIHKAHGKVRGTSVQGDTVLIKVWFPEYQKKRQLNLIKSSVETLCENQHWKSQDQFNQFTVIYQFGEFRNIDKVTCHRSD